MDTNIPVFFLEPTDRCRVALRRYASDKKCPVGRYYCEAYAPYLDAAELRNERGSTTGFDGPKIADDDPRWPAHCSHCGEALPDDAPRQHCQHTIYRRIDDNSETTWLEAPVGAMRYCWWLERDNNRETVDYCHLGPDGHVLEIKLPGGTWIVDTYCSNCDRKGQPHDCWVRHGDPRNPSTLTVNKNGNTCGAGAGSIWLNMPHGWHGFLENGILRKC